MKKILSFILICILSLSAFTFMGCNSNNETQNVKYTIATPDGAPTMAVAGLMRDTNGYESTVISGADVASTLTKGEMDFVIAPTNAGMKLALAKGKYKILATTSWGNLYLVGTTDIKPLEECASAQEFLSQLQGATIESIGTNQVPDISFKHLLSLASVACTLNASVDAPTINASLKNGTAKYGILGEPAVTGALKSVTGLKRLASISDLWASLVGTNFPQASVFVKTTLSEDTKAVNKFLNDLENSINYLNSSEANALELGTYMEQRGDSTLKGALVKASYLKMNQRFVLAKHCKQDIINFVRVLGVTYTEDTHSWVFYGN